jgi:hypothetical protein
MSLLETLKKYPLSGNKIEVKVIKNTKKRLDQAGVTSKATIEVGAVGRVSQIINDKEVKVIFWDNASEMYIKDLELVKVIPKENKVENYIVSVIGNTEVKKPSALDVQVAGDHYKTKIQPIQFIHANNLGFCEGNAIKYLCRHKKKNGIEDLKKAKHYIELLIELEYGDKSE